jgi:D-alanine-D-alanine ligase
VLVRQSRHLAAGAVVEPYREGAEDIEVSVRTYPGVEQSAISKPVRTGGIYSYGEKYVGGEGMLSAPRDMNPELPDGTAEVIREAVVTVAALARVRGVARVDFLLAGGEVYVNEINTIPGSLSRHLWADQVPFDRLLADMLEEAGRRPPTHWTVAGADGSALRAAGSIEGKLG